MAVMTDDSSPTLEDFLGSGENRFFGSGYRRVGQRLSDIAITCQDDGSGSVSATAGVSYPVDWSRKSAAQGVLRPHLSTIDALVFGAQLAELYLSVAHGLDAAQRSAMWLRRVAIKAGPAADEDGLGAFPVDATVREAQPNGKSRRSSDHQTTVVDCRVGQMKVGCTVEHHSGRPTPGMYAYPSAGAILAPDGVRPFSNGYRYRRHTVERMAVDAEIPTAQGWATVDSLPGGGTLVDGIEAAYQPSVTMIDAFVIGLQLGQILLYEMDDVPRGESNTLWMRRTTMSSDSPLRPGTSPFPVTTSLANCKLLEGRGGIWRTADIVGEFKGIQLSCAVTHRLPTAG